MTAPATIEPRVWPRSRWWLGVLTVLLAQVLGIFVLGERSPVLARRPVTLPALQLSAVEPGGLLALADPTLFALPHPEGFAGATWLKIPNWEFQPPDWSDLQRWLPVSVQALGAEFERFTRTNEFSTFSPIAIPSLEWINPDIVSAQAVLTQSRLQLGGSLSGRRLLSPMNLPSQHADELLTNTVVQVLVDGQGRVFSAVVLPPGSGSQTADQLAQQLSESAQFEPLPGGAASGQTGKRSGLTMGTMTFVWKTLAATNTPTAAP